jgi:hypothetical protein
MSKITEERCFVITAHNLVESFGFFSRESFFIYFFLGAIIIGLRCVASVIIHVMVHDVFFHVLLHTITLHITNVIVHDVSMHIIVGTITLVLLRCFIMVMSIRAQFLLGQCRLA